MKLYSNLSINALFDLRAGGWMVRSGGKSTTGSKIMHGFRSVKSCYSLATEWGEAKSTTSEPGSGLKTEKYRNSVQNFYLLPRSFPILSFPAINPSGGRWTDNILFVCPRRQTNAADRRAKPVNLPTTLSPCRCRPDCVCVCVAPPCQGTAQIYTFQLTFHADINFWRIYTFASVRRQMQHWTGRERNGEGQFFVCVCCCCASSFLVNCLCEDAATT